MCHRSPGRSLRPPSPLLLLLPLLLQPPWAAGAASQSDPTGVHCATAYWSPESKKVEIKTVLDKNGDAYGYYNDSIKTTGWGILEIRAGYGSQVLSNEIIMFLAGYLEGYLTALAFFYAAWLFLNLLYNPGWPQTHRDSLASATSKVG